MGTVLTFNQSAMKIFETSAVDGNIGGGTFVVQTIAPVTKGSTTIFLQGELKIPAIGVDSLAFHFASAGPGNPVLSGGGGGVNQGTGFFEAAFSALTYTVLGPWTLGLPDNTSRYYGFSVGGFQTPAGGLPSAGTGTYSGAAYGRLFVPIPSGVPVSTIEVNGNTAISVNFSTGAVNGSLTNLTFGTSPNLPWNDVNLVGSMSGTAISGTTSAGTPPTEAGKYGFSSTSTGVFNGALYGPNAQEIGAIWSLYDPSGKAALGMVSGKK